MASLHVDCVTWAFPEVAKAANEVERDGGPVGRLSDKVAIVTGAARGHGESAARLFASLPCFVASRLPALAEWRERDAA